MINNEQDYDEYQNDVESFRAIPDVEHPTDYNENPLNQQLAYVKLINDEAMLQRNSTLQNGKVVWRSMKNGEVIAMSCDENPTLKYIVRDVEFSDDQAKEYSDNVVCENILTRVYSEGYLLKLIDFIVD